MRFRLLPPLNALKAFEAVIQRGSFSAAARSLDVSQGAVSRHIKNLEDFLGTQLFERSKGGARLTAQGRAYSGKVSPALNQILDATIDLVAKNNASNILQISASPSFAVLWLTPRLQQFQMISPQVRANITISDQVPENFIDGFDVAIVPEETCKASKDWIHLFDEILVPVCSPSYADQMRFQKSEDLLRGQAIHTTTRPNIWAGWISKNCPTEFESNALAGGSGFQDHYLSIEAACSGAGVALVPKFLVKDKIERRELIMPVNSVYDAGYSYWLVPNANKCNSKSVQVFVQWMKTKIPSLRELSGSISN